MRELSRCHELFLIIIEELLYNPDDRDYQSVVRRDFSPERMEELKFTLHDGAERQFRYEDANQSKALVLNSKS